MKNKITATAKVQVTFELDLTDSWGNDCKADQIFKQAKDSALQTLNSLFSAEKPPRKDLSNRIRIIGTPKVLAIYGEEKD